MEASRNRFSAVAVGEDVDGGEMVVRAQSTTFVVSVLVQVVALGLAIAAVSQGSSSDVLSLILILEISVGGVELLWYSVVGVILLTYPNRSLSVSLRYIDWFVTTPTMLVSIVFFAVWDSERECATLDSLTATPLRVAAIPTIVVADWAMLAIGVAYELTPGESSFKVGCGETVGNIATRVTVVLDSLSCGFGGLYLGFLPFFVIFGIIAAIVADSYTTWALVSVVLTFCTWLLYGVVAIMVKQEGWKNAAYNILDILRSVAHRDSNPPCGLPFAGSSPLTQESRAAVARAQQERHGDHHFHRLALRLVRGRRGGCPHV